MSLVGWLVENVVQNVGIPLIEGNYMPDFLTRWGIRTLLGNMIADYRRKPFALQVQEKMAYVKDLKTRSIAEFTVDANKQHYEVPAAFYAHVMGEWRKYSCGAWPAGCDTLDESEAAALALVCDRAGITPGVPLRVLDMGCGWGSFTLYVSTHFPLVTVVSVSNSASQAAYINAQAAHRGVSDRVTVVTCDINTFSPPEPGTFDRLVSIEMMEHAKNYEMLLNRISTWLNPSGKAFVHIFTHRSVPFHYTTGWMAENFFTGGQMPSDDLLLHFQRDMACVDRWIVPGTEYERTCNEWLRKMDAHRGEVLAVLGETYGKDQANTQYGRWRLFMLSCAELFGYEAGNQWVVSHYLFENKRR
jgi:cyclopropane-fatty-acyl-phospholipid synthase